MGDGMSRPARSVCVQPNKDVISEPAVDLVAKAPVMASTHCNGTNTPIVWADVLLRTFEEVRDELVSTLWYVLGDKDDAQDIAQEVFLRCWRTQEGLPEVQNLRAWIFRVGLNAAKDLQRSAWKRRVKAMPGSDIMPTTESPPPTQGLEDRETLDLLHEALMHLRPEEKEVFLLRQNGELTYEQIAEMSSRPVGTVKTQMRSALSKLRKVLAC
jgi:RNA polymerase sigma-70 factor (ECF subfamily)